MSNLQLHQWYWSLWRTPPGPEGTPTCLSVQQQLILSLYLSSASMGRGSRPTAQSTPWSPTALMELWLSSTFKAVTKGPTTVLSLTDLAVWALQLYFQYKVCFTDFCVGGLSMSLLHAYIIVSTIALYRQIIYIHLISTYVDAVCSHILYNYIVHIIINPFSQFPQCSIYFLLLTEMW